MPEKKPESPPDGWKTLRPENDPDGAPQVGFDPKSRRNYHVGAVVNGEPQVIWHGVPEGFRFTTKGQLVAKDTPDEGQPAQIVGTPEQPASIPLSGDGEVASG